MNAEIELLTNDLNVNKRENCGPGVCIPGDVCNPICGPSQVCFPRNHKHTPIKEEEDNNEEYNIPRPGM